MRTIKLLVTILILICTIQGCKLPSLTGRTTATVWERRARVMAEDAKPNSCTEQVFKLTKWIREAGDGEGFITVRGTYRGTNHVWLEKDGITIDPSVQNQHPDNYIETSRFAWTNKEEQ